MSHPTYDAWKTDCGPIPSIHEEDPMNSSFLDTKDDLAWLHEVHGVDVTGIVAAEIVGNEDCPERVLTYARDDYREKPTIWARDTHGTLVRLARTTVQR